MSDDPENPSLSSLVLYQADDQTTRIEVRLDSGTVWLTQAQLAELFQTSPQNITLHLKAIYEETELSEEATCKSYLQVRQEGGRDVSRNLRHYNLEAILAVGYRVRSHRGTQFRQWATARLRDYLVTGFAMDDERLKNPPGPGQEDYFEQLLARIRDIRSSERVFWRKVLDIYATSVDYDPSADASKAFFATVQNKMHWAAHGHTAAEVVHQRADATKAFMGLTHVRSPIGHEQALKHAEDEADALLANHPEGGGIEKLLQAVARTRAERPADLSEVGDELDTLVRFVEKSLLTGAVRSRSLRKAVAALAYLRNPYDRVFDLHVEGGFADDIDVIRQALASLPGAVA